MAANNDDPGDTQSGEDNSADDDAPEQNPVRLTLGHYYCAKCGEDSISQSDAKCPRCQANLRWDSVAL